MTEQLEQEVRETMIALHYFPKEERLKLQGVIAGMRLARELNARDAGQLAAERTGA